MMFQGTYQSPFYRKLHKLLHDDLELRRQIADCRPVLPFDTLRNRAVEGLQIADWRELSQSTIYNLQFAIDQLNAEWFELGRLEIQHRSTVPTLLARTNRHIPAPDLSKEWN